MPGLNTVLYAACFPQKLFSCALTPKNKPYIFLKRPQ